MHNTKSEALVCSLIVVQGGKVLLLTNIIWSDKDMSEKSYKAIKILTFIPSCILGIFLLLLLGGKLVKHLGIHFDDTISSIVVWIAGILIFLTIPCFVIAAAGLVASVAAKRNGYNGYSNMNGYIILGIINVLIFFQPLFLYFIMWI